MLQKTIIPLLWCVVFTTTTWAQDSTYAITFGGGGAFSTTQDRFASDLIHTGFHGYASIGYIDPMSELEAQFQYGQINTGTSPLNADIQHLRGDINYRQYIPVSFLPNEDMNIGLGLLSQGSYRRYPTFVNNDRQYDFATALSLEYRYIKALPWSIGKRTLHLRWHASLPFFALTMRPGYNTSIPDGYRPEDEEGMSAVLNSLESATFNNYWRFISKLAIQLPFINGNAMELHYQWDVYQHRRRNMLSSGTHQLGVTLHLNTKRP